MKNLCFLSYISGHVWFSNLEKENETGLYSLQALSWSVPVYLYKVIPLLTHYIPAILNVSVSQTHHLINSCWKTLPPSHFAWFSPNPLSCICSDTAAFQKLVQTVWVPSSLFPQVLTFPCCWLPALKPVSCTRVWAPWGWGQCSRYCWLTAGLWSVLPLPSCWTC